MKRRRADGSIAYRAQVRARKGEADHSESQTFARHADAQRWIKQREGALGAPGALRPAERLGDLIRRYIDEYEALTGWQRTKGEHLRLLTRMAIANADAARLHSSDLVEHIRQRRLSGTGPATAGNDLIWIGVVLKAARSAWGLDVDPHVVEDARSACRQLRLIAKAAKRTRRPTADELARLDAWFRRGDERLRTPMADIMWFAVYSARRQAEITRLRWADQDATTRTGMVRDAKHPTRKIGNHRRFKYTPEGWEIAERQPRVSEFVFPFNSNSVGAAFTRACRMLGIVDLRFHDLRHEATSQLFERGYAIHEVAQFTLHESWQELKRYTQLRPEDVRVL